MEPDWLVEVFEEHRPQLRAVAYRMLGSVSEADDALQDAWLRVSRADTTGVENLGGWLTTVVARVCLNMLRSRERRREQPLEVHVPEPILGPAGGMDPEQETLLADAVGLALMVVLDTLTPAERLAFVLHDMFAVPFEQIAPMVERSPAATRQLASRARRRVRGQAPAPDPDLVGQRAVVEAFFASARSGDLEALVAVLDPDVVLRADGGAAQARPSMIIRGARAVASQAVLAQRLARFVRPVLINGTAGAVTVVHGRVFSVMAFTIRGGQVAAIDVLYDPQRLVDLDLADLDDARPGATPGPATGSGRAASLLTEANSASADSTWVLVREPSASADAGDPAPPRPGGGT